MSIASNSIMEWYDPRPNSPTSGQWVKISDHGRSPLSVSVTRIENTQTLADGSKRRYVVAKKRTFSTSWENFPNVEGNFLFNGKPGDWMVDFHNEVDGAFRVRFRTGADRNNISNIGLEETRVFITSFSHEVVKRGKDFDFWSMDLSLEEV